MNSTKRNAFFISDGTAVTAEALGHSLLSQFPKVDFNIEVLPFVDTRKKATDTVRFRVCIITKLL